MHIYLTVLRALYSTKMSAKFQYSAPQRAFAVKCFLRTDSVVQARLMFAKEYGSNIRHLNSKAHVSNVPVPNKKTIFRWVKAFDKSGSLENKNLKSKLRPSHSGRMKTQRTPENMDVVRQSVRAEPRTSVRRRSAQLDIPRMSLHTIMRVDLKLRPYVVQVHQRLTDAHKEARVEMCRWFLEEIEQDATFLYKIWFSDEAHFYLNGHVSNKNFTFWGSEKPDLVYEKGLHDKKVTVWVAMSANGLIGPFFFEDDNGAPATVNADRYLGILSRFWRKLHQVAGGANGRQDQWFQQDGAAPHVARHALQWIANHFGHNTISRNTRYRWSANSPDLSPLDFHLWGFLKDGLRGQDFESLGDLKAAIVNAVRAVPQQQCGRVIEHFTRRLKKCIERNGSHIEHVI